MQTQGLSEKLDRELLRVENAQKTAHSISVEEWDEDGGPYLLARPSDIIEEVEEEKIGDLGDDQRTQNRLEDDNATLRLQVRM